MFVLIMGKLNTDIMNGGLWGYGSIDYALLMPQKVRQLMPKKVWQGIRYPQFCFRKRRHLQHLRRNEMLICLFFENPSTKSGEWSEAKPN
jgi:hypothetical protein